MLQPNRAQVASNTRLWTGALSPQAQSVKPTAPAAVLTPTLKLQWPMARSNVLVIWLKATRLLAVMVQLRYRSFLLPPKKDQNLWRVNDSIVVTGNHLFLRDDGWAAVANFAESETDS